MHALLKGPDGETSLEHRVASLLEHFCRHPQQPLTKESLLEAVWAGRVVNEDSLSVAVSKLRKLLQDSRGEPQFIKTIPGVGYCWLPETSTLDSTETVTHAPQIPPRGQRRQQRRKAYAIGIAALTSVAVVLLGYSLYKPSVNEAEAQTPKNLTQNTIDTRGLSEQEKANFARAQAVINSTVYHEVSADDYRQAIGIYRNLLKKHPNFTPAHIGIAEAKFEMSGLNGYRDLELYTEELNTITTIALTQKPDNGHALELKAKVAFLAGWDLDAAEQFYSRAIEAMPNDPGLYLGFSEFLITRGKIAEAKDLLRQLRKKNPDFFRYINLSLVYMFQGDYDKAIAETQRLMNSEAPTVLHNSILHRIGVITENDDMAMDNLKVLMRERNYSDARINDYERIAETGGLQAVFAQLLAERNEDNLGQYIPPLSWARYAIVAGETEQALFHLSRAIREKQPQTLLVHEDPHFDPLRQLPEFQALLAQIPH